jgi:hypothetical protein
MQFQPDHDQAEKYGTSSRYRIARLKRDHPEIADALARGEYPSVRAAAKAAGLVHEPTPIEYVYRYWRKVSWHLPRISCLRLGLEYDPGHGAAHLWGGYRSLGLA